MSLPDEVMKLKDGKIIYDKVASMVAVQYAEAESNPAGSYVIYNGSVYLLPNGHTANTSWANTEKEGPTNIGGKLSSLSTEITNKIGFVTPEDFGAKGDGTTDDTQAIKDMFASSATEFHFPNKKYRVTGGIDVTTSKCVIDFCGETEFSLAKNYGVRDFDYVIAFKTKVTTIGKLHVDANFSVNVGIWLSKCAGSTFDHLSCNYARVWGVCTDSDNASLGSMTFHKLEATACGYKVNAVGKCTETDSMLITDMTVGDNLTEDAVRSVFDSKFGATKYIVDDSGYDGYAKGCRYAIGSNAGIVLDEEDHTKGTFAVNYAHLYTAYNNNDEGRAIFIPIGGGIRLQPSTSEGIFQIDYVSTMRCPIGIALNMQYGGIVGRLMSQYDTICMTSNCLNAVIQYMYAEGIGSGFAYTEKYDRIYLITNNTGTQIEVINPFLGMSRIPFYQENEITISQENVDKYETKTSLRCSAFLAGRKLNSINTGSGSATWEVTIDEYSPREYTIQTTGTGTNKGITLDLVDLNARRKNQFAPAYIYFRKTGAISDYEPFQIRLSQKLIDAGYDINNGVNNEYQITSSDYDRMMKVTIVLFNKTFFIQPERVNHGDYAEREEIPVSIISPVGNSHVLQPYPVTYDFGVKDQLTVTVTGASQYRFKFKSPTAAATTLSMDGIIGTSGDQIEAGKTYIVDVWAGIATIKEISYVPVVVVGTDLVDAFIGRDSNGKALMDENKTIDSNGDVVSGERCCSEIFIPFNPAWRYKKNGHRIYLLTFYDSSHSLISQITGNTYNNLDEQEITNIPSNTAFIRFCTNDSNLKIGIIRIE